MDRRTTMQDVAAAAGVSPATASRALSGNSKVDPELVRRVSEASTRLGYSANAMARALRTQRTDTIGVVQEKALNQVYLGAADARSMTVEHKITEGAD